MINAKEARTLSTAPLDEAKIQGYIEWLNRRVYDAAKAHKTCVTDIFVMSVLSSREKEEVWRRLNELGYLLDRVKSTGIVSLLW